VILIGWWLPFTEAGPLVTRLNIALLTVIVGTLVFLAVSVWRRGRHPDEPPE